VVAGLARVGRGDLGAENRGRAVDLAEMGQRNLHGRLATMSGDRGAVVVWWCGVGSAGEACACEKPDGPRDAGGLP
jgi:hypothetical protein